MGRPLSLANYLHTCWGFLITRCSSEVVSEGPVSTVRRGGYEPLSLSPIVGEMSVFLSSKLLSQLVDSPLSLRSSSLDHCNKFVINSVFFFFL